MSSLYLKERHSLKIKGLREEPNKQALLSFPSLPHLPHTLWLIILLHDCAGVCSVAQSCPALCASADSSLPGSFAHEISQAPAKVWLRPDSHWQLFWYSDWFQIITVTHLDLCWAFRKVEEVKNPYWEREQNQPVVIDFSFHMCSLGYAFVTSALILMLWGVKIHSLFLYVFKYWSLVPLLPYIYLEQMPK